MALLRRPNDERPTVWLLGDTGHVEFAEVVDLLHASARVGRVAGFRQIAGRPETDAQSPELIVLAQSRPGMVRAADVDRLRQRAPLAGIVTLAGSWCEGEVRTGRPAAGVSRLYWYEFPSWWRRQIALRAAGRCPDWARQDDFGLPATAGKHLSDRGLKSNGGLVALDTTCWETADALADVLRCAGFATAWSPNGTAAPALRGVVAGIWEGRQLDRGEANQLSTFCRRLSADGAPVVALLDFPRRDRCEAARTAGAATVLGKPWANANLLAALRHSIERCHILPRAA